MIGLIIISILWVILMAISDYGYIASKSLLWHGSNALLRVILSFYISSVVLGTWTFALVFLSAYWILFDMLLNKLRKQPLLYVGFTSGIDLAFWAIGAKIKKSPGKTMLATKVIVLIISILIFSISYGK